MQNAGQVEAVLTPLRNQSGLKTGQITQALRSNPTTVERMRRLAEEGLAARDESGGWFATSSL